MNKLLELFGEPAGIRTRDPLIKSQVLYRLSYGLSHGRPYGCVAVKVNLKHGRRRRLASVGLRKLQHRESGKLSVSSRRLYRPGRGELRHGKQKGRGRA